MGAYWGRVLAQAWADTKHSFGWNHKTRATILVGVGTLVAVYFRSGGAAMTESMANYAWYGLPLVLAGFVLFGWNFIEAQAKLYKSLLDTSLVERQALEAKLRAYEEKAHKPNYEAVRRMHEFTLRDAAHYWCDQAPKMALDTAEVRGWYTALIEAVRRGELKHIPKSSDRQSPIYDQHNIRVIGFEFEPDIDTCVTRKNLREFAEKGGKVPKFLQD